VRSVGYWASQEQYSMQDLIKFVIEAEKGGFTSTMTSDHFHPWWNDGGFGNFTWIWLAAASERTNNMQFVTGVTSPVYRYNPAIIAQAFASLDTLYPNRISLGIGTGEAMNEVSVGFEWPSPETRLNRTIEAIQIINNLWNKGHQPLSQIPPDNEKRFDFGNTHIDKDGFLTYNGQYFRQNRLNSILPPPIQSRYIWLHQDLRLL
jgi:coenzyme F420-dependent glucose-6-phosphate dehydrogenase